MTKSSFSGAIGVLILMIYSINCNADDFRIGAGVGSFQSLNEAINGSGKYRTTGPVFSGFGNGIDLIGWGEYQYRYLILRVSLGQVGFEQENSWGANGYDYNFKLVNKLCYYPIRASVNFCAHTAKSKIYPYIGFGAGLYFINWREDQLNGNDTTLWVTSTTAKTHKIGFHINVGSEYALTKIAYWAIECEYSYVNGKLILNNYQYSVDGKKTFDKFNFGGISIRTAILVNLLPR